MRIELPKSIISKDENGIIHIEYKSNIDFTLEDFPAHKNALVKLAENKKVPFLIDLRQTYFSAISNDVLRSISKDIELQKVRLCNAFVIAKISDRLMVNLYLRIFNPKCPAKTFKTKENAVKWCIDMLHKANKEKV